MILGLNSKNRRVKDALSKTSTANVYIQSPAKLTGTPYFTIEFWMKLTGTGSTGAWIINERVSSSGTDGANNFQFHFSNTENRLRLGVYFNDSAEAMNVPNTSLAEIQNIWTHITFSYNYNNRNVKVFVNGVEKVNATTTKTMQSNNIACRIFMGGWANSAILRFDGLISELRAWNEIRTEQQIRENMYVRMTGKESKLTAYYPMDRIAGTKIEDEKGSNDMAITGVASFSIVNDKPPRL
jgi:hypothetical protein